MSIYYNLKENKYLSIIVLFIFLLLSVLHLVLYFLIRESDFGNIFDTFESSPLFNFQLNKTKCLWNSYITFHKWEGRKKWNFYYSNGIHSSTKIVDETNIDKINGYKFCYKHIPYKNLLYNGQIIKNEEDCPEKYNKSCGIIDTLNQKLCIKDIEKCPLYDVGIGQNKILDNYTYNKGDSTSDIYYNNYNYDIPDKKIIGKLILNNGQPCYRINEKLWRKFDSDEAGEEHLKCELEIFGKLNDDRYENKGDITYKQLYIDNLSKDNFELIEDDLEGEKVSLYKREFLGIDKTCDEKSDITKDQYKKLNKNQRMEKDCLIYEFGLIFFFLIILTIFTIKEYCNFPDWGALNYLVFIDLLINSVVLLIFIICHIVFLIRIMNNDISYNCSDDITNEVLRNERKNTKKSIIYSKINLFADLLIFLLSVSLLIVAYLAYKFKDRPLYNKQNKPNQNKISDNYPIKNYNSRKKANDAIKVIVENNNNENIKPEFDNSQIERIKETIVDNKDEKNYESIEKNTEQYIESKENNLEKNNESIEKKSDQNEKSFENMEQNKEINDNKYPDLDVPPPIINKFPLDSEI